MTEAEIRRDPYSSALADRPTAILTRTLWFSSLLMGAATLCLGLVVVFGWHTGNRTLVQVCPNSSLTFPPQRAVRCSLPAAGD